MKIADGEGGAPLRRNSRENLDQILEAMIERPEEHEALAARIEASKELRDG